MTEELVKFRDSAEEWQRKLKISKLEFNNLKSYARQAHQEFCKENPSSSWADLDVIWSVIPAREKEAVVDRLDELYKLAGVFTSRTEVVESGYEQRLNLARAAWLQEKRKKRREEASGPSRPGA